MTPLDRLLAMKRPFLNAGGLETQQIYQNPQSGRTTRRRHGIGMSLNLFASAPVLSTKSSCAIHRLNGSVTGWMCSRRFAR